MIATPPLLQPTSCGEHRESRRTIERPQGILSHDAPQASIQHRNMAEILVDGNLDVDAVRSHFPALKQNQVFLDNAGGTQILSDAINSYVACPLRAPAGNAGVLILSLFHAASEPTSKKPTSSSAPPTVSAKKPPRNTTRASKPPPIS